MHCIVAWEIHDDSFKHRLLNREMLDCFEGYSIAQVLSTLFVINVENSDEYVALHDRLLNVAQEHKGRVEFVMSPLMRSGQYAGYFDKTKWDRITEKIGKEESAGRE